MRCTRRGPRAALLACAALAVAGCGAAQTVKQAFDPVARAADVTDQVSGYRVAGTTTVSVAGQSISGTMSGVIDRARHSGSMSVVESVLGRTVRSTADFDGLSIYLQAAGNAGMAALAGGKPWVKYNLAQALGSVGLTGTAGGSDPSQLIDYLRAAGAKTQRVGTATIRGVATTHYHVIVDLDRYARVAHQPGISTQGVALLERALGTHSLPMDVWLDHDNLVRQMHFAFDECLQAHRINLTMTLDLFDYGTQPAIALPSSSEVRDITPVLKAALAQVKFGGCTAG